MSVYQKLRKGVPAGPFQFIDEVHGIRNTGTTGTTNRAKAERYEAGKRAIFRKQVEERIEMENEARMRMEAQTRSPIYTLGELLPNYHAHLKLMGFRTAYRIGLEAVRIVEFIGAKTKLTDIDNMTVRNLLLQARELSRGKRIGDDDPLKNRSINSGFLYRLRCMLGFAKSIHKCILPFEPDWKQYKLKEDNVRTLWLTFRQSDALDEVLLKYHPDFYAIDRFARASALRLDNLVNLAWSEVDWEKREINVTIKGGFKHAVPITREIEGLLRPLIGHHKTRVFTVAAKITREVRGEKRQAGRRYPLGREMYKLVSRDAFRRAGIVDGYSIHCHRHTADTWLYAVNQSLIEVQRLLGHKDIRMTLRYTKLDLRAVRTAMEAVIAERIREQAKMLAELSYLTESTARC
ncbi:tyrosine-type recombinase/integrase [Methylobacterium sp. CM6246]